MHNLDLISPDYSTLEVDPNSMLPQVVPSSEKEVQPHRERAAKPKQLWKLPSRNGFLLALAILCVIGAAIGRVIGVTIQKQSHQLVTRTFC